MKGLKKPILEWMKMIVEGGIIGIFVLSFVSSKGMGCRFWYVCVCS